MIHGYKQINLQDILNTEFEEEKKSGEAKAKEIISTFSCPLNPDIEDFLKNKSIEFSKQGIAKTHLVFSSFKEKPVLVGYYALASNKSFVVADKKLSSKFRKRLKKFALYDPALKQYSVSAPLIAQLSKNFTNGYNKLIPGNDLLKMACDKIEIYQNEIGGKILYLECEDIPALIDFYKSNGFVPFGEREREKSEENLIKSKKLIQLFKYRK